MAQFQPDPSRTPPAAIRRALDALNRLPIAIRAFLATVAAGLIVILIVLNAARQTAPATSRSSACFAIFSIPGVSDGYPVACSDHDAQYRIVGRYAGEPLPGNPCAQYPDATRVAVTGGTSRISPYDTVCLMPLR